MCKVGASSCPVLVIYKRLCLQWATRANAPLVYKFPSPTHSSSSHKLHHARSPVTVPTRNKRSEAVGKLCSYEILLATCSSTRQPPRTATSCVLMEFAGQNFRQHVTSVAACPVFLTSLNWTTKMSTNESGACFKTPEWRPHSLPDFCMFTRVIAFYTHLSPTQVLQRRKDFPKHVGKFIWFEPLRNCLPAMLLICHEVLPLMIFPPHLPFLRPRGCLHKTAPDQTELFWVRDADGRCPLAPPS